MGYLFRLKANAMPGKFFGFLPEGAKSVTDKSRASPSARQSLLILSIGQMFELKNMPSEF